ncbi:hypothetical protein ACAX61_16720 [Sphingomonas sp. IW22]
MALIALPVAALSTQMPSRQSGTLSVADPQVGQTAQIATGRVGQRQSRAQVRGEVQVLPMMRISNRVANRVQTRIRNRIDRNYAPSANATAPFQVAADQARAVDRARR